MSMYIPDLCVTGHEPQCYEYVALGGATLGFVQNDSPEVFAAIWRDAAPYNDDRANGIEERWFSARLETEVILKKTSMGLWFLLAQDGRKRPLHLGTEASCRANLSFMKAMEEADYCIIRAKTEFRP